ncbi:MAG: cell division protein ZapA [Janthinobacterium lividum]
MGQVNVSIGGRSYTLSCSDDEEAHLEALAAHLAAKAVDLTSAIGAMSEPRLLLMAGIQVADELFALRGGPVVERGAAVDDDDPRYAALLARIEALSALLEPAAG